MFFFSLFTFHDFKEFRDFHHFRHSYSHLLRPCFTYPFLASGKSMNILCLHHCVIPNLTIFFAFVRVSSLELNLKATLSSTEYSLLNFSSNLYNRQILANIKIIVNNFGYNTLKILILFSRKHVPCF